MDISPHGAVWVERWEQTLTACERLGGKTKGFFMSDGEEEEVIQVQTNLLVAPPATESAILALEDTIGRTMPSELRQVLTQFSAEVNFGWQIPVRFDTSAILKDVPQGDCHWSLAGIVDAVQAWRIYFQEFTDEDLFAFMALSNGDLIAIRGTDNTSESPVVYVDHEYGIHHLRTLGHSFIDFMNRWTRVGCAGPEWWMLRPFIQSGSTGILADSDSAVRWRKAFFGHR